MIRRSPHHRARSRAKSSPSPSRATSRSPKPTDSAAPLDPLLAAVGAAVRALREQTSRSRRQLSDSSGLSERFLADLEAGTGNISVHRLAQLCAALGTTPGALLLAAEQAAADRSHRPPGSPASIRKAAPARSPALPPPLVGLLAALAPDDLREAEAWLRARFAGASGPLVALLGLRGAGKSTLGRLIAERLSIPFVALDERVEAAAGLSLAGIFSFHGEAYYRRLAREVLARLLSETGAAVIATGGSIVTDREALRLLGKRCRTVWLQATPEDHWQRVLAQGDERPGAASDNAQAELRALLQARAPLYAQAELHVDTSRLGLDGAVEAVLRGVKRGAH